MGHPPGVEVGGDMRRPCDVPLHWARAAPERIAFYCAGRVVTYAGFADDIALAVDELTSAGVRSGDRVVIAGLNCVETAALFFAAQVLGAWPAVLNPRLSAAEFDNCVKLVDPSAIALVLAECAEAAGHAQRLAVVSSHHLPSTSIARLRVTADASSGQSEEQDHIGALLFTSGTTGQPKAVMLGNPALLAIGEASARLGDYRADDAVYGIAPFAHIIGLGSVLMAAMSAGVAVALAPRFDPALLARDIASGLMTRIMGVPMIYSKLLDHIDANAVDVSGHCLRSLACGGAPLDPKLKRRIEERFGLGVINGYGCTEISPIARSIGTAGVEDGVGVPFAGVQLRLVQDGHDVDRGATGEIWVRGPYMMQGYYRDPAATAAVMRPHGWMATGDVGRLDPEGRLSIVGRIKEMIIRSGFNVYPAEVEVALNAHPAVCQSAVIGRRVADQNEEVVAFIELHPGANVATPEIREFLGERLTPYKKPSQIIFMSQLPIGTTGKVCKQSLRRLLESKPL